MGAQARFARNGDRAALAAQDSRAILHTDRIITMSDGGMSRTAGPSRSLSAPVSGKKVLDA
jgi:hypothetical protein